MRNHTEIRFSDTTGNGKFSGKPDLPFEIFFLGAGPTGWASGLGRIAGQMGLAQQDGTDTVPKSATRERSGLGTIGLVSGPCQA